MAGGEISSPEGRDLKRLVRRGAETAGLVQLLDITQAAGFAGLTESTLKRLVKAGRFPRPVQFRGPAGKQGGRVFTRWSRRDLEEWVERLEDLAAEATEPRRPPAVYGSATAGLKR